jgi:hypothetical protein
MKDKQAKKKRRIKLKDNQSVLSSSSKEAPLTPTSVKSAKGSPSIKTEILSSNTIREESDEASSQSSFDFNTEFKTDSPTSNKKAAFSSPMKIQKMPSMAMDLARKLSVKAKRVKFDKDSGTKIDNTIQ